MRIIESSLLIVIEWLRHIACSPIKTSSPYLEFTNEPNGLVWAWPAPTNLAVFSFYPTPFRTAILFKAVVNNCRAVLDRLSSTTISEVPVTSDQPGLLPAPLDVATFAVISANATCGGNGAEEFCRETAGKRVVVCDVCEGPEGSSSRRHPAGLAVDGDPSTWWQSPIITDGDYQHVELVAVLPGINKSFTLRNQQISCYLINLSQIDSESVFWCGTPPNEGLGAARSL
ncbi:unnamed protein product [Danaus chrysippus]|uniref:(African queen) hypothetical protein n=1 Tax=Danaus chrysippus TaxID=151541 RepID=A0A8J2W4K7_9NEOP|nr:unnamed protein product [Danaus chrysippus]